VNATDECPPRRDGLRVRSGGHDHRDERVPQVVKAQPARSLETEARSGYPRGVGSSNSPDLRAPHGYCRARGVTGG